MIAVIVFVLFATVPAPQLLIQQILFLSYGPGTWVLGMHGEQNKDSCPKSKNSSQ